MKKLIVLLLAMTMSFSLSVMPAMAYNNRGTVTISAEAAELTLEVGQTYDLSVVLTPAQDDQMEGCGMSDCPENCGANCLSKDHNCTCGSTSYETYYSSVKIKNTNEEVADAEYSEGIVAIEALSEGETTLKLGARLREYTGSSIEVKVIVVPKGQGPEDPITKYFEKEEADADDEEYTAPKTKDQASCCQTGCAAEAESIEITTENHGEEDQQVHLALTFSDAVEDIAAGDFSGTLAGNDILPEDITVEADENTAVVTVKVMAIKAGVLEMTYNGEAAKPFAIHAIVSPGMQLELVSQDTENASVTMRVSELYHVRGIARVMLLEDGEPVLTDDESASVFTGIHGHDFLELDAPAIAEKIVFGLNETHPEGYSFTFEDDTVTVVKEDAEDPVELMLAVQESAKIEQIEAEEE